jgi:RimJ/RimL family protein N-acetyltransferase
VGGETDSRSARGLDDGSTISLAWQSTPPVLSDGSLTLRPWRAEDVGAVFAAGQDAETQRWIDVPVPFLAHHAVEFVGSQARQQWSSRRGAPFATTTTHDDRVLGSCGLVAVNTEDLVAQVVWAIDPSARGQGFARRAGRLLCDWALTDLGLARLEFYIEPANAASRAVAKQLGCQMEGILRSKSLIQGTRRDIALYALLP